jgi:hypothetical protein
MLNASGLQGIRHKFSYNTEAEALRARGDTNLHTKRKAKPSTQEGIRHKFTSKMETEAPLGKRGYGIKINTKWKLKPSGQEGIRHTFIYKMEAGKGNTASDERIRPEMHTNKASDERIRPYKCIQTLH